MPVTDSGGRAWNTPNEGAELLATDYNGQGRDVIMLSHQIFAQGHGEKVNPEISTRSLPSAGNRW